MGSDRIAASYDAVAEQYAENIGDELKDKPVDRAWLNLMVELAGGGPLADVGCGPGHVTAYLAEQGARTVGIDISPGMIAVASSRYQGREFVVGSLLALPAADAAWSAAVCPYSIIHLEPVQRPAAFAELARVIAPGGWLLLSFHIDDDEHAVGEVERLTEWWGEQVELEFHYLDPDVIAEEVGQQGFVVMAVTRRRPWEGGEHPSRRCHLLAQRAI
jgi:ubiquinone/menaquinone biosynthesis C-methylase UbiE